MAFKFVLALALISAAATFNGASAFGGNSDGCGYCANKKIGGDILSLPCIIKGMCAAKNDEAGRLKKFYACYDDIPTKQFFFDCMDKAFGGQLNNSKVVANSCRFFNLGKVLPYGACLALKFRAAGEDMNAAVTEINKCQADALGLKRAD